MAIIGTAPNGASIVAFPNSIGLRAVELSVTNVNAVVTSPFTGQQQIQQWPGADMWSGTITFPPMTPEQEGEIVSFGLQLRGMANCFLMGDPLRPKPAGTADSRSAPVVDMGTASTNYAGAQTLYTRGWVASAYRLLLPGDYIQIGYRLHRVLDQVNSDNNGRANFQIAPSLREVPSDGEAIILNHPQGLFRLATNKTTFSSDYTFLSNLSLQVAECR